MDGERRLSQMFRDLLSAAGWYGMGMVLRQVATFLLLPIYTRHLSPSTFGVLSVFGMAQLFANVVFTLGLTPAMFRFGADPDVIGRWGRGRILSTVLLVLALWNGIMGSVFLLFAHTWAALLFGDVSLAGVVRYLVILVVSESLGLGCFTGNVLRLRERAQTYALVSVGQAVIQIIIAYLLVARLGLGLQGALSAMVVASVSITVLSFTMVAKELARGFAFPAFKEMLRYSLLLVPGLFATGVLDVADRYILRLFLGLEPVGLYEAGYRIGKMVNFALVPFTAGLPPLLYSLGQTAKSRIFLARVSTYMLALSLGVAAFISIFAREITTLVTGSEYVSSWSLVPWIAFGTAAFHMANIFTGGLHFAKRTDVMSATQVTFALITIVLCLVTVPILGISGAAVTTLVTFSGMALILFGLSYRAFPAPYEFGKMAILISLAIIAFLLTFLIREAWGPAVNLITKSVLWLLLCASELILLLRDGGRKHSLGMMLKLLFRSSDLREQIISHDQTQR